LVKIKKTKLFSYTFKHGIELACKVFDALLHNKYRRSPGNLEVKILLDELSTEYKSKMDGLYSCYALAFICSVIYLFCSRAPERELHYKS